MCINGVYDDLTRGNVYDNGACQQDRGMDHAIRRVVRLLQKHFVKHGNTGGICHLDVCGYFPNTPHNEPKRIITSRVHDTRYQAHLVSVIDSFRDERPEEAIVQDPFGERGIYLGSQISQLVQLAVPNHIMHCLWEDFGIPTEQYMDDFLLIGETVEQVTTASKYVQSAFADMGLHIKDKSGSHCLEDGFTFLHLFFKLTETGKVIVKLDHRYLADERRKLRKLANLYWKGKTDIQHIEAHYQSFIAIANRADSHAEIKSMDRLYAELFRRKPNYKYTRRRPRNGRMH